jgi:hypothetical protein
MGAQRTHSARSGRESLLSRERKMDLQLKGNSDGLITGPEASVDLLEDELSPWPGTRSPRGLERVRSVPGGAMN